MPRGPKGQKRPVDVIGNAFRVMRIAKGKEPEFDKDSVLGLNADADAIRRAHATVAVWGGLSGAKKSCWTNAAQLPDMPAPAVHGLMFTSLA